MVKGATMVHNMKKGRALKGLYFLVLGLIIGLMNSQRSLQVNKCLKFPSSVMSKDKSWRSRMKTLLQ